MDTVKVGMIGFGGIARLHKAAYEALEKNGMGVKLVAVCDTNIEQFEKKQSINISTGAESTPNDFNKYAVLDDMLEKEELDLIDICVPTMMHADLTCKMLSKGYNVLCEKPMARTYEQCTEMIAAKDKSGKKLMIGQCVRFAPEYMYLKELCETKKYGNVKSAYFHRLSSFPTWDTNSWLLNPEKSGGCLLDMHIHDLDFSRYAFGEPQKISCSATKLRAKYDTVQSRLYYDGFTVEATGDWGLAPDFGFFAGFRVTFEEATVELKDGVVTVYPFEGEKFNPQYENTDFFYNELDYLVKVLKGEKENTVNPPESAAMSVKLAEALRTSADNGGAIMDFE